nr:hypothetical protein [Tanacetum cinerariifolium]GFA17447.1 hypothetical protein [Tanacetum cinerariifolium]
MYQLQKQVLDLKEAKTAQAKKIASLKKRVKKLEHKRKLKTSGLKRIRKVRSAMRVESSTKASLGDHEDASKQGRMIDNIDQDVEITLVDDTQGRMNEEDMFGVNDLDGDEVVVDVLASKKVEQSVKVVEKKVSTIDLVTTTSEVVTTTSEVVTTVDTELVKGSKKAKKGSEKTAEGSEKAQKGSSKRATDNLEQEDAKRQKIKEYNESAELKRCLEIILEDDDDLTIEATPISSKSQTIVDYKI